MSLKSQYKQWDGDSACKNKSKKKNGGEYNEPSFSRKISLEIRQLPRVVIVSFELSDFSFCSYQ